MRTSAPTLIIEYPRMFDPILATLIGVNEAIALQQLQFWLTRANKNGEGKVMEDGRLWVHNSWKKLSERDHPYWTERTTRNLYESLEAKGLVLARIEKGKDIIGGQRRWMTIDHDAVWALTGEPEGMDRNAIDPMDRDTIPPGTEYQTFTYNTPHNTETHNTLSYPGGQAPGPSALEEQQSAAANARRRNREDMEEQRQDAKKKKKGDNPPKTPCGRHIVKAIGRGTKYLSPSEEELLDQELTAFDKGQQRTFTLNELYEAEPLFGEWLDVLAGKLYNRWRSKDKPIAKKMMFTALTTGGGEGRYKVYQTIQDFFEFKESRAAKESFNAQGYAPSVETDETRALDAMWATLYDDDDDDDEEEKADE